MILASREKNGKVKYFDARTGMQYKPGRENGRHLGRIPDDVMRFLSPKVTDILNSQINHRDDPKLNLPNPERYDELGFPKRPSWLSMFLSWLKSLINGRK